MNRSGAVSLATRGDLELVITRAFAAPRRLVFDAFTEPSLLRRWYGQEGWTLVLCEVDLRPGGAWRFVSRLPDGREIGQRGVYREVAAPDRLVRTESWEDWNPGELVTTVTLAERGGVTTLTDLTVFPSLKVRDMLLASGLADGAGETYDRLDDLLLSLS
jgi:uncharacterized protein YndB with AHSA1/START domain